MQRAIGAHTETILARLALSVMIGPQLAPLHTNHLSHHPHARDHLVLLVPAVTSHHCACNRFFHINILSALYPTGLSGGSYCAPTIRWNIGMWFAMTGKQCRFHIADAVL